MLLDYTKSNRSESEKYRQNILNILSNLKSFKPFNYSHYFNTYKAAPLTKSKLFVEKNSDNTIYMEKSYKIIKSGNIKDYAGLNILKCIIGDGDKSILFNKLRTEKNLVYSVNAKYPEEFYAPNLGKMIFSTTVSAENKNYIKDVLQEFQTTTEKLQSELVPIVMTFFPEKIRSLLFEEIIISIIQIIKTIINI